MPWTEHIHKRFGNGLECREISHKFGIGASTACDHEKANTAGTDENLFRLVPVHGGRELPLELVAVPGHGAQICARAQTKGYA